MTQSNRSKRFCARVDSSRVDETRRMTRVNFHRYIREEKQTGQGPMYLPTYLSIYLPTYLPTVIFRIVRRVWSMHNASLVLCEGVDSSGPYHYTYVCKRMGRPSLFSVSFSFNLDRWHKYGIFGKIGSDSIMYPRATDMCFLVQYSYVMFERDIHVTNIAIYTLKIK